MYTVLFKPKNGWGGFEELEELENTLMSTLGLKERNEGRWHHLSFTNWEDMWELDSDDAVLAVVELLCSEDNFERIESLKISTRTKNVTDVSELKKLVGLLLNKFKLTMFEQ